jgi:hypothetical protein
MRSLLSEIYDLQEDFNVQDINIQGKSDIAFIHGGNQEILFPRNMSTNDIIDKFKKMYNDDSEEAISWLHKNTDRANSDIFFSKVDSNNIFQFPGPSYTMTTSEPTYFDRQDIYPIRAFSYY